MKKTLSVLLSLLLVLCLVLPALAETPSIALVVAGSLGDRSFYDSAKEGADQLAADHGTKFTVIECKEDSSLCESSLFDAADSYDMIAAIGWQFGDYLLPDGVLGAYPNRSFLFIDNALEEIPENIMCITYKQNEGAFLGGYIAGKLSKTGKVGAVGGEDVDTIPDFLVGYEAGAKFANPDVQVMFQYANTYENPSVGKQCALTLYNQGCDIVYGVAGKTGEGVFEAAAETGNLAIGVDGDQKYINPDVIICSMVKRVGKSIYDVVSDSESNFKGGTVWNADMATGYIDVVYGEEGMPQQVSDELKAEVESLKQQIISGEIVVPSAFD